MSTEEKNKIEKMSLVKRIILVSVLPNLFGAAALVFYAIFSIQASSMEWMPAIKFQVPMVLVFEFIASPILINLIFGNVSRQLDDFYKGTLSEKERMNLFRILSHTPMNYGLLVMGFFFVGSIYSFFIFKFICHIATITVIFSIAECLYCSCLLGAISFTYVRKLCTNDLRLLIKSGLPKDEILKQKSFGQTLLGQTIIFIILPTIVTGILSFYVVWMGYYPLHLPSQWTYEITQINRMISMCILNFTAQSVLLFIMNKQIIDSNKVMTVTLEDLEDDLNSDKIIETDLHDEIAYNQYLSNLMLNYLRNILIETHNIGKSTDKSANELCEVANETESTALEQSTATNEIVATMEDANTLSRNIEEKISIVSDIADQTAEDVSSLYSILERNLQTMAKIQAANSETIQGIKDVNEKMNNIWEIINLINSIADTTKIIAFNAELEATKVHEGGRNFKNVANEIRRLANGTMDSTKEIKDIINDIQAATDKLTTFSSNSTVQIMNGMDLAHSLENSFTNINSSASESAESAAEIKMKIDQETEAFKQILLTLHQISRGIDSFSSSTRLVLDSANDLQISVRELNNINEDTVVEDCHHCEKDNLEEETGETVLNATNTNITETVTTEKTSDEAETATEENNE